jgi:hypothetical protein
MTAANCEIYALPLDHSFSMLSHNATYFLESSIVNLAPYCDTKTDCPEVNRGSIFRSNLVAELEHEAQLWVFFPVPKGNSPAYVGRVPSIAVPECASIARGDERLNVPVICVMRILPLDQVVIKVRAEGTGRHLAEIVPGPCHACFKTETGSHETHVSCTHSEVHVEDRLGIGSLLTWCQKTISLERLAQSGCGRYDEQ